MKRHCKKTLSISVSRIYYPSSISELSGIVTNTWVTHECAVSPNQTNMGVINLARCYNYNFWTTLSWEWVGNWLPPLCDMVQDVWLSVYNEDHWLLQQWRLWKHWECRISSSFLQFWNPSSHGCKSGMNIIRTQRHDLVRSVFAVFGNTQLLTGPELVYWSLIYMTWSLLPRIHILV